MERIKIDGELCSLVGTIYLPEGGDCRRVLVGLPGKGGPKERFHEVGSALSSRDIVTVTFDFSGRGESVTQNIPATRQQIDDLERLLSYTIDRFPKSEIGIVATSMGAMSACVLAQSFEVARLILVAPTIIPNQLMELPFSEITGEYIGSSSEEEFLQSEMIAGYRRYAGQVILIQLEQDDLIPDRFFQFFHDTAESASVVEYHKIPGTHGILHDEAARGGLIELLGQVTLPAPARQR